MKHRLWETGSLPPSRPVPRVEDDKPEMTPGRADEIVRMLTSITPDDDKPSETRILERKREWAHGDGGRGTDCSRKEKPIFTAPEKIPTICRDYACDNEQWDSQGVVIRDKTKKTIVHREKSDA